MRSERWLQLHRDGQQDRRGGRTRPRKPDNAHPTVSQAPPGTWVVVKLRPVAEYLASNDVSTTLNRMAAEYGTTAEPMHVLPRDEAIRAVRKARGIVGNSHDSGTLPTCSADVRGETCGRKCVQGSTRCRKHWTAPALAR